MPVCVLVAASSPDDVMDEADVALVPGDITMDSPNDAATRQHRDNGATQGRMADRRRRRFKRQSTSFRDDASDPDTKVTEISSDPPGSSNNGVFHPASRPGGHDYRSINVKDTRCHSQDSEYSYRQPSPRTHHRHRRPRYLSEADSSSHSDSRSSRRWHACFPKCRKRRRKADGDAELTEDDLREIRALKEPRRKQCMRACFNFLYVLLAIIAIVVTYSMIQDLVTAMKNPVRSIHYKRMQTYNAPGKHNIFNPYCTVSEKSKCISPPLGSAVSWNPFSCKTRTMLSSILNVMAADSLGYYSLSGKTSWRQIFSWSLEPARLDVMIIVSLWNLTGISTAPLPRCLPNFRAIGKVWIWISLLRD